MSNTVYMVVMDLSPEVIKMFSEAEDCLYEGSEVVYNSATGLPAVFGVKESAEEYAKGMSSSFPKETYSVVEVDVAANG